MKAWQAIDWCEPEGMQLNDVPVPEPGPSQVRIRNHAAALNFFDLLQIQGKYQVKAPLPFTPGAEVGGIVDAIGEGVTNVRAGDRVLAFTSGGGYAQCSIADSFRTFPMPNGMSFEEAASVPIVYHTSWFALKQRAALQPGEWLLVHAGASGVGMSAIQIGKALGARVIATAGDQRKVDFAIEQGAEHGINYSTPDWVDRVKEVTERRGADVIYDPVGGDVFDLSTKCIAREGRILVIGFAGGRIPAIQTNRLLLKNISAVGVFWGDYANSRPWYLGETQTALDELYAAGKIRPVVGKRYPLDQAPEAMRDLAGRKIVGKAVLEIRS
jgi:NADPH2:quinone reductase